jgi:rRNA maturation RNase YbeY
MAPIHFFSEDIDYELPDETVWINWLEAIANKENKEIDMINYIFCSDEYLHQINVQYLGHDTLTDIITFPYSEEENTIEGDIFISIDRVKENSAAYNVSFEEELKRIMAHGILHMCGYMDKKDDEKELMSKKENEAIAMWSN